jgi:hypothetical protein
MLGELVLDAAHWPEEAGQRISRSEAVEKRYYEDRDGVISAPLLRQGTTGSRRKKFFPFRFITFFPFSASLATFFDSFRPDETSTIGASGFRDPCKSELPLTRMGAPGKAAR